MKPTSKPSKPSPRSGGAYGRGATVAKSPGQPATVFKQKTRKPLTTTTKGRGR